jgi:hypothetical protein
MSLVALDRVLPAVEQLPLLEEATLQIELRKRVSIVGSAAARFGPQRRNCFDGAAIAYAIQAKSGFR